ncbi:hypothetical protein P171DRAFT_467372 [Karstenula rhodostoma CBS 690.94]|uniref:Na+/solute symporter n=1 Tax=Karstenula rhodostoma CBS 690.94 TaxID=1392251 RepID=A0A9P4P7Z6_9PLEO|nr:hypothetical protein P171DRAFT_467372 [Karstenula rhodostoma CBS 690.94]
MANELVGRADEVVVQPSLSQAVGYVVVVVIGLVIAFGMVTGKCSRSLLARITMVLVTKLLKRTVGEDNKKTEIFMTANRSVNTGLTASAVVSSWLWSTAMLGSSLVGYANGVSGPFWFAAGCSPMMVFFAVLGISCKRQIPEAHTLLEIVRIRYGTGAHIVYMFLCLLWGMHIIAATFLLPVGVAIYTFVGGIKATFLANYMHTFTILIILCYFSVKASRLEEVGSLGNLCELVKAAGVRHPVTENEQGSYLAMTSKGGILFGILHICANFGLVMMDTSFFIKAFSASPRAVVPGCVVGGIAYFSIPWAMGTLASSVVLGWKTILSFQDIHRYVFVSSRRTALTIGGAAGILLITFMAATSSLSAQVIAVSSIISFDIYRTYFKHGASDEDCIRWSHYRVIFFALSASDFSTMLHYVGADLGCTRRQSKAAAIIAPLLGMVTGIASWLGSAYALYGAVTIATTGQTVPCVWGTVASAFSPLPENFDWADFRKERLAFEVSDTSSIISRRNSSVVLWPLPMYASKYIFGKGFFAAWLVIAIIWLWGTLFIMGFYPLIEGRHQIWVVWQAIREGRHNKGAKSEALDRSAGGEQTPESVEQKQGKTG